MAAGRAVVIAGLALLFAPAILAAAQSTTPPAIQTALRAELAGPGMCFAVSSAAAPISEFFDELRFYRGVCRSEHGDSMSAIVARDSAGLMYLLDSPSGWRFLLSMHPPNSSRMTRPREYAAAALEMQGELRDSPTIFKRKSGLALNSACLAVARTATGENDREIGRKRVIRLLLVGEHRASLYVVTINADGTTLYIKDDCWREAVVH